MRILYGGKHACVSLPSATADTIEEGFLMAFDIEIHDTVSVKVPQAAGSGDPEGVGHTRIEVSLPSKANVAVKASNRDLDLLVVKKDNPRFGHLRTRLLLWLLGLSGDEAAILPSRRPLVRRMLGGTSTYVEVQALALPAKPEAADRLRSGGIEMTEVRYDLDSGEGFQFNLPDGEQLNMEPDDGSYSMAWTTALPLTALIPRLEEFLRSDPHGELTIFTGGERRVSSDESSRSLLESVLSAPAAPAFWRLDTDDVTLTWEAHDEGEILGQPGLLGIIADEFNGTDIQALLENTATPLIGAEAPLLVARCSEAAKRRQLLAAG